MILEILIVYPVITPVENVRCRLLNVSIAMNRSLDNLTRWIKLVNA